MANLSKNLERDDLSSYERFQLERYGNILPESNLDPNEEIDMLREREDEGGEA